MPSTRVTGIVYWSMRNRNDGSQLHIIPGHLDPHGNRFEPTGLANATSEYMAPETRESARKCQIAPPKLPT